jgi:HK97 gp10 family phage protein
MNSFNLKSSINSVIRALDKAESRVLDKAATHLRTKLKEEVGKKVGTYPYVSYPGEAPAKQTGKLQRGIAFTREPGKRFIGFRAPASHAHLLEFGTGPRIVKNYMGKKGVSKDVGPMAARSFFLPTFDREEEVIKDIIAEKWL